MDKNRPPTYAFEPIGYIESCYSEKFGTPRQSGLVKSSVAELKIRPQLQPAQSLQGLEGFSHIWLIWVFHKNNVSRFHAKVHPPRYEGESLGLFATRSPHRPNPIGLSLVRLNKIENNTLYLSEIDLIDGTPILDIKPYLFQTESILSAKSGWIEEIEDRKIEIIYLTEAENFLDATKIDFRPIIEESIKLDPRPLIYRNENSMEPMKYRNVHIFEVFGQDVHFRFISPERAEVIKILPTKNTKV